ncbi:bomanin Tailed 2-like [Drosophila virilis]|uniref:Uncharacterized protein n=1 Tax=Drosophila virilis TaxID=7244 RepID=B4LNK6_DROVI|nr:uncharacterized protein LOC6625443 [Drosophila virilis]XP_032292400.1 uncharacterized protein LOC116650998 [Drosophila virilis]EDW62186.1 uncharacterized protein Dvir_GJ19888 [Drosophila virilis]
MNSIVLHLLLLGCLLAMVCATPGKVVINGKCIDCNRPEDDDSVIIPGDRKVAGAATQALASGAVGFGLLYYLISVFLHKYNI